MKPCTKTNLQVIGCLTVWLCGGRLLALYKVSSLAPDWLHRLTCVCRLQVVQMHSACRQTNSLVKEHLLQNPFEPWPEAGDFDGYRNTPYNDRGSAV